MWLVASRLDFTTLDYNFRTELSGHVVCCVLSCVWLCDPMDCSLPGSSVHGILQTKILEWVAISYSRGSSQPRDPTHVSCISCIGRHSLPLCHLDTFKVDVSLSYPLIPDSLLRIFFFVDFFFTSQHPLISHQTFLKMRFSCSVAQSCPTLCSTSGFPVLLHLPEFAQTHVHWVGDAIQTSSVVHFSSCPQSFPASGSFFQWVSSSHQVAKVLEFQLQHQSFQWTPRTDLLAVQGTLQHHSSKAWILRHSAFFMSNSHIHHKIRSFKVYALMVFGIFTKLYSHHYNLILAHFITTPQQRSTRPMKSSVPIPLSLTHPCSCLSSNSWQLLIYFLS